LKPERLQEVERLYHEALERDAGERAAFLEQACGNDDTLLDEVNSLLAYESEAEKFIEAPAFRVAAEMLSHERLRLAPGQDIGPYKIVSAIGAGGMGEVYRARDSRLGRDVAIKVLPVAFADHRDRLRRFEQEARAAGLLNHPNILAIYELGTHDGSPYVVSELLEGENLRTQLRQGPLSQRKAVNYALQIIEGLAAAHEKGIVHRDLKPENLFITKDGRIKILDFGLAKLTDSAFGSDEDGEALTRHVDPLTNPGTIMGTAGYMSPEQVRGERVDHRSDIFSFGTILYEMLSGKRAFQGDSAVETMNAILTVEPPLLTQENGVSPAIERIVHHCLEKNVALRFQSVRDIGLALEALSGLTTAAAAPLAVKTAGSRSRWLIPVVVLGIIAALVGGTLLGVRLGQKEQPSYQQLAFRRGTVWAARFAPDGQTIIYGASWEGRPSETFSTRHEATESRSLGLADTNILAISPTGEMAIQVQPRFVGGPVSGTLARVPLAGGAPREITDNVIYADWSPDGKELAVVRGIGGKWRLEFPIGKVLYETEAWMSYPRVSPKGDLVAFFDQPVRYDMRGSLVVVDLSSNKKILASGATALAGLAWHGDEIWFSGVIGDDSGLWATNLSGRQRLLTRFPGFVILHDISRDGRVLMTHENVRVGIIGLPPNETKERDLSWLDGSFARDMSADGKTLLFDEELESTGLTANVYVRKMDGSPAIRLGEGYAIALSPDGKWALTSLRHTSTLQLVLLPTGVGEPRPLPIDRIIPREVGAWFPDGKRILFVGNEPGHEPRCYVVNIDNGKVAPVTPEGITAGGLTSPEGIAASWITPDSKYVIAGKRDEKLSLYPLEGGEPAPLPGLEIGDVAIRWTSDGRALYFFRLEDLPAKVYRLDVSTGRRELWKELLPPDPAGISIVYTVEMTPDAKSYAYTYLRDLSDLYLIEGLK